MTRTTIKLFDIDKRNSRANLEIDLEAATHELEMLGDQLKDQPQNDHELRELIDQKSNQIAAIQLKLVEIGAM